MVAKVVGFVRLSLAIFVELESLHVEVFSEFDVLSVLLFGPILLLIALDEEEVARLSEFLFEFRVVHSYCKQSIE